MRKWILPITLIIVVFSMLVVGCATPGGYVLPSGETFLTQAAENIVAATVVARQTAEAVQSTAQVQAERQQATVEAREQFFFELTQTAIAVQATATAEAHRTATAVAATTTAAARAQATATAEANATSTAVFDVIATQTAAPIETRTAGQLAEEQAERDVRLKRLEWEEKTAALVYVAEIAFWGTLIVICLWTLVWAIPRLYHLLALKLGSRNDGGGDKAVFFVPLMDGLRAAWLDAPRLLAYDHDRDRGPGQVIDGSRTGLLPGGDPSVTFRDQAIDMQTRPVIAAGGHGRLTAASHRGRQRGWPGFEPSRLRGPSPGLVHVVAVGDLREAAERGVLPPGLADAIEGQWTEVDEEV
jgi:hypothetical protein